MVTPDIHFIHLLRTVVYLERLPEESQLVILGRGQFLRESRSTGDVVGRTIGFDFKISATHAKMAVADF